MIVGASFGDKMKCFDCQNEVTDKRGITDEYD